MKTNKSWTGRTTLYKNNPQRYLERDMTYNAGATASSGSGQASFEDATYTKVT
ncbi:MAG: hypothetical protein GAK35_03482 [Herbaspirillum frisingense]|uniref:Uncharacterized protein n=1 Tax=Herbaspirillum frisingense TaxID=92645 RepID=A0A7V8FU49_9BURK|nr:MAG: hypothetical protein GAK35_03482 [Herbaspirillum frisingense]